MTNESLKLHISNLGWVEFPDELLPRQRVAALKMEQVLRAAMKVTDHGRGKYRRIATQYNKLVPGANANWKVIEGVLRRAEAAWEKDADHLRLLPGLAQAEVERWATTATADAQRDMYLQWIGMDATPDEREDTLDSDQRLLIIVADVHGFPHRSLVRKIIETAELANNRGLDVEIVWGGDLFDVFCTSQVGKPSKVGKDKVERTQAESRALAGMFAAIGRACPYVRGHVVRGNHDMIMKMFPDHQFDAIRYFVPDPLETLVAQFPWLEMAAWNVPLIERDGTVNNHYKTVPYAVLMGDAFVSHLNKTGGQPMQSVNACWSWIQSKRMMHGLNNVTFVAQAHSHKLSYQDRQASWVQLTEIGFAGCLETLSYQVGYNAWTSEVGMGFVTAEQTNTGYGWRTGKVEHVRLYD